jgi:hypothetical protein
VNDANIQISLVPADYVPGAWPLVAKYIDAAVYQTDGRYTLDDVYTLVVKHGYLLWVAIENQIIVGAVVTGFVNYPRKKALFVMFLGGDKMRAWKFKMLETLRQFAREQACDIIEASGREGWSKVLKEDGFRSLWHTFEIPLEPEEAVRSVA